MSHITSGSQMLTGFANYFTKIFEILDRMKREDINNLIVPLHEEFIKINMNYFDMFYRLRTSINGLESKKSELDEIAFFRELKKIIDDLEAERRELEPFRDQFRGKLAGYLQECQNDSVQNYLVALGLYFTQSHTQTITSSASVMQMNVRSVLERGGHSFLPTPSIRLWLKLKEIQDIDEMRAAIAEACEGIAINMSIVSKYYYALRSRRI